MQLVNWVSRVNWPLIHEQVNACMNFQFTLRMSRTQERISVHLIIWILRWNNFVWPCLFWEMTNLSKLKYGPIVILTWRCSYGHWLASDSNLTIQKHEVCTNKQEKKELVRWKGQLPPRCLLMWGKFLVYSVKAISERRSIWERFIACKM